MLIGNITVRENCRWTDQAILHSKISSKSWPLAVKSPVQSLDYRANSYHIHLNTLRFHGCGKEISQICPCPFCPINTSFSGTLPPSCHSTASNPPPWRRHCSRTSRTPARISFTIFWVFDLFLPLGRNGHQLRRPWGQLTIPLLFILWLYSCSSANLFTEHPFSSFFLFSISFLFLHPPNPLGIGR